MDVPEWLETLGLSQYREAFEANDIEWELLPDVDQETLKDIGVESAGHRLRLLKAIRLLGGAPGQDRPSPDPSSDADALAGGAQRRQLTVMFCDLVGSTALSRTLDPEDYRDLLAAYQDVARAAIARYDGYIARYMGDGLLVYFGFPRAHEDDVDRAVRAALEIARTVPSLGGSFNGEQQVRIGIATGEVVVGDIVGEGAAEEHAVLGETPNLAARLQGVAEAGEVLVAESTKALLRGKFALRTLAPRALKGFASPVASARVVGVDDDAESRAQPTAPTPIVGRDEELSVLRECWEQTRAGNGQSVLIGGEPGIGKSRLLAALDVELASSAAAVVRLHCSAYHVDSAFYAVAGYLRRAAGVGRDDLPAEREKKLSALLGPSDEDAQALRFGALAAVLGFREVTAVDSTDARSDAIAVLLASVARLAKAGPLLMTVEDVHWMDPSSAEFTARLIEGLASMPVMLVLTHRPELPARLRTVEPATRLALPALARRHCERIVTSLLESADARRLDAPVVEQILSRTDGIPLFVEELTKSVLDSNVITRDQDEPLAIPASLKDSLSARLDACVAGKPIAQCAAVIGATFDPALLAKIWSGSQSALDAGIKALHRAGLVADRGATELVFSHALIADSAYASMLGRVRRAYHRTLALTLEAGSDSRGEAELIARHWLASGEPEHAVAHLHIASERANAISAHAEALVHSQRALDVIEAGTDVCADEHLALLFQKGISIEALYGTGADRLRDHYAQVAATAAALGKTDARLKALGGLTGYQVSTTDYQSARATIAEMAALASRRNDPFYAAEADRYLGILEYHSRDFAAARAALERAVGLLDSRAHRSAHIQSLRYLNWTYRACGELRACWRTEEALLAVADASGSPIEIVRALFNHVQCLFIRGEFESAEAQGARMVAIARKHGLDFLRRCGELEWCRARFELGRTDAIVDHERALEAIEDFGQTPNLDRERCLFAINLARAGQSEAAHRRAARALSLSVPEHRTRNLTWVGEVLRLTGGTISGDPLLTARGCFEASLAAEHGSDTLEAQLEPALGLARVELAAGNRAAALAVLEPRYRRVRGFPELALARAARSVMEEIQGR